MLNIHALKAFNDNYIWVLGKGDQAIIIDAGDAQPVLDYLADNALNPIAMIITHHHDDHTGGVAKIKKTYPDMQIIAHSAHGVDATQCVDEGDEFELLGVVFKVWRTAGHTDTHLSYLCDMGDGLHVFCGDTLFSGGCGRVFTGTMGELFDSMMRFNGLADDTLFYPAHEYTLSNLKFGHTVCADDFKMAIENAITDTKAKLSRGEISLPTTLSNERQINVFLQVYHEQMIDNIRGKYPLDDESPLSVFTALRELKNNF